MAETVYTGIKHHGQRVGVFIDVQNMYYSARHLYNSKVNFGEILKTAVADRNLIRAIAYVVRATGEEDSFFEALNQRGLETKEREMQTFMNGAKKADWDVGITVDAIRIGELLDVVVLVTGDGDFIELVEYLQHHGRQVEVIAFRQSTSSRLIDVADDFTDLSEHVENYLIKHTNRGRGKTPEGKPEEKRSDMKDAKEIKATKEVKTPQETKPPKDVKPFRRIANRKRRPKDDQAEKTKGFFGPDAA